MKSLIFALFATVFFVPIASANCLSHVAGACDGGTYNPDTVVEFYKTLAQRYEAYNQTIGEGSLEDSSACIINCEANYRAHVQACNALPQDDPVIGNNAKVICLQQAENVFSQCVLRCMQPNTGW